MNFFDETKTLRDWIEDGARMKVTYTKMDYYWSRYGFIVFRLGVCVGFTAGGILAIAALTWG